MDGAVPGRAARRRARRGFTLMELMVALAILILLIAVVVPSLSSVLMLEQRNAARKLSLAFEQLQHEAVLRNKTYRVVFDLSGGTWHIEEGDAGALVFSNPDAREDFEEAEADRLDELDDAQRAQYLASRGFSEVRALGKHRLPEGMRFASVFTPQYEEPVKPEDKDPDEVGPLLVFSYVFADGQAEFTVVQLVEEDDPDEGFTITVDPLAGRVDLVPELIDQHDKWAFLPDDGPDLP